MKPHVAESIDSRNIMIYLSFYKGQRADLSFMNRPFVR